MSPSDPFALLITWTCYGTWLPGDARGFVSPTLLPKGGSIPRQNVPGTPITADDSFTRERARQLQKEETVFLTREQALIVAESLVSSARKQGWRLPRGAVMANHMHVVVQDCPDNGPAVRRVLKGTSQAALNAALGGQRRWWTQGGSDRYKHGWEAIEAAVKYVAGQPGMLVEIVDMQVRPVG
jgi:REP element-mobilizing transposase RayT